MLDIVLRRLIVMPVLILGIVTATFVLAQFTKGNPLVSIIGAKSLNNPEIVAAAKKRWGLDRSVPERYVIYIENLAQGDLGVSFRTKQPVLKDLAQRLPATLELVICAMIVGAATGLLLGVVAAQFHDKPADHAARFIGLLGSCIPLFWLGLLALFLFSVQLPWLPGGGRLDLRSAPPETVTGFMLADTLLAGKWSAFADAARYLILPSLVLGWSVTGIVSRMVRASMLDVLKQDFIIMARAKGASGGRVLIHHALRNALIPTLTILGFTFAYLITGSVLVETIFSWPGIGSYAVDAARNLDYPAITGVTILGGIGFLIANLLTDIAYAAADPQNAWRGGMTIAATDVTVGSRPSKAARAKSTIPWRSGTFIFAIFVLVSFVIIAVTIPLWSPYDPIRLAGRRLQPPSALHWCGTDSLGRDVLTRALWGTRYSLPIAALVLGVAVPLGVLLGAAAGFLGGIVDNALMRLADVTLAFPPVLLAMAIAASLGPGLINTAVALVIVWWPIYARLMRAQVLSVKKLDHVEAAVIAGAGRFRVLFKHIMPLCWSPILVNTTMDVGQVILLASGLSFIGLGAQPPTPEWGQMVADGASNFYSWWIAFAPGMAIFLVSLSANFLGDAIRDVLDPRFRAST